MDDRNRDRGTIKWTSLMLPEHVELIKEVWQEDEGVPKKVVDEQQAEENEAVIQHAIHDELLVGITYYNGFNYSYRKARILHIDPHRKRLSCRSTSNEQLTIEFEQIYEVVLV
ncbi:YolD-like family protein [Halobacillus naozhouensis]|uniref:YolD-like family protein n=1 Tax=Halobacillus naozhouensis TaxID=554880 RepID=A0ABY8J1P7_9BACI|nr:YolD-like family protein [Halobacillus naozhouensis]WFT76285.1 YolD-like family protein [Halobacillus naozhouensis]